LTISTFTVAMAARLRVVGPGAGIWFLKTDNAARFGNAHHFRQEHVCPSNWADEEACMGEIKCFAGQSRGISVILDDLHIRLVVVDRTVEATREKSSTARE